MTAFSDYLEVALLNLTLRNTAFTAVAQPYVSLHTADPVEIGSSEVVPGGNAYVRKAVTFGAPVTSVDTLGKVCLNTNLLQWLNMPGVTVTYGGVWDALSGGNFLYGGILVNSVLVTAGGTYQMEVGDFSVTLK